MHKNDYQLNPKIRCNFFDLGVFIDVRCHLLLLENISDLHFDLVVALKAEANVKRTRSTI
jgi:hypothetical protein